MPYPGANSLGVGACMMASKCDCKCRTYRHLIPGLAFPLSAFAFWERIVRGGGGHPCILLGKGY